jgi:hypothetical protein
VPGNTFLIVWIHKGSNSLPEFFHLFWRHQSAMSFLGLLRSFKTAAAARDIIECWRRRVALRTFDFKLNGILICGRFWADERSLATLNAGFPGSIARVAAIFARHMRSPSRDMLLPTSYSRQVLLSKPFTHFSTVFALALFIFSSYN